jgi:hypothetical protein
MTAEPRCEPETLDAWARRTAPTLTDKDWSEVPSDALPGTTKWRWHRPQARALLAELDRLLGGLTDAQRQSLTSIAAGAPYQGYIRTRMALLRRGLLEDAYAFRITPLGRACLARAGQRQSGEKSGPSGQRKEGP